MTVNMVYLQEQTQTPRSLRKVTLMPGRQSRKQMEPVLQDQNDHSLKYLSVKNESICEFHFSNWITEINQL